jgi:hypothetical protein
MKKRILFLATTLLAILSSTTGKSQAPTLPKPTSHPLIQFKHKEHRSKGKGMPHFFQVKK